MGDVRGAIPLAHVVEIMRPLPVNPLAGVSAPVLGVAIVRGAPVPVVDAAQLVSRQTGKPTRFVCVRHERHAGAQGPVVALAVDEVSNVAALSEAELAPLPPLLGGAPEELIASLGRRDAQLLVVLRAARIVPDDVWNVLSTQTETA